LTDRRSIRRLLGRPIDAGALVRDLITRAYDRKPTSGRQALLKTATTA